MSWEDCGFKPGKIYGPAKCPKGACGDCDGDHHFYIQNADSHWDEDADGVPATLPEGLDPTLYFACKHCDTKAEAVDADGGMMEDTNG